MKITIIRTIIIKEINSYSNKNNWIKNFSNKFNHWILIIFGLKIQWKKYNK
jgi:hypothetical protein